METYLWKKVNKAREISYESLDILFVVQIILNCFNISDFIFILFYKKKKVHRYPSLMR